MNHARWVGTGEAAALTGTTPGALRDYHRTGLLPEPERGPDGRCRYGYEDVVRILWVRRMAELGMTADGVRAALAGKPGRDDLLADLEASLERQQEQTRARLAAVRQVRAAGGDLGLLDPEAVRALGPAQPEQRDLDSLLRTEHLTGPAAAVDEATGHRLLALHPRLRAEQRRLELEMEALADPDVSPEDPRVAALAHDFSVHLLALEAAERAAQFPEPDFTDEPTPAPAAASPPVDPEPLLRLPGLMSPALARVAELLGDLLPED